MTPFSKRQKRYYQITGSGLKDQPTLHYLFEGASSLAQAAVRGPALMLNRDTTKRYFDANGVLQTAAIDEPAFGHEYVGGEWVHRGFRHSKSRTNICLQSTDFSATGWTVAGATIDTNVANALDGQQIADRLNVTAGAGRHDISRQINGTTSGATYCASVVLEDDGSGFGGVCIYGGSPARAGAVVVNLSTGEVTDTEIGVDFTLANYGVVPRGDGKWRVYIAGSLATTTLFVIPFASNAAEPSTWAFGRPSYTAIEGEDLFMSDAQLVAGAFPGEIIRTTTAQVTQDADQLFISTDDFAWRDNKGKFYMRFTPHFVDTSSIRQYVAFVAVEDAANHIYQALFTTSTATGKVTSVVRDGAGGTLSTTSTGNVAATSGVEQSWALEVDTVDFSQAANGSIEGSSSSPDPMPSPTSLHIGAWTGDDSIDGWLAEFRYWNDNTKGDPIEELTA